MRAVGVVNPFTQALLLRLVSGWLALLVFARLARVLVGSAASESTGRMLFAATIFLWFMPYLSVRFSSENWSSLAFFGGLSLLPMSDDDDRKSASSMIVAGLLLGLAFMFRFQIGFALVGVAAWLAVRRRVPFSSVLPLALGGLVAFAIGTAVDAWFYGHLVFTPWRYFDAFAHQVKADEFGVSPWWFYFTTFLTVAVPPISLILLILAGFGVYRARNNLMTWAFASFVMLHVVVGHKEMRFLFPMAFPLLWLAVNGWESLRARIRWRRATNAFGWITGTINLVALIIVCTRPAQQFLPAWRFLYDASRNAPVTVYVEQRSPYDMEKLKPHFYDAAKLTVRIVPSWTELNGVQVGDLVLQRHLAPPPRVAGFTMQRVFRAFPDWVLRFNVSGWEGRTEIWSIYRVGGPGKPSS